MVFAHDTELALAGAAALINTAGEPDQLPDVPALQAFVTEWRWTGDIRGDERELSAVKTLRPRLRAFWGADRDDAARLANVMLSEARALPQLVTHDGFGYHLHATPPNAPLHRRMAVEAAMAMVDVVRMDALDRLRVCDAEDCADVFVDLSKNRSRRFCGTACGNRLNVAAYRTRQTLER